MILHPALPIGLTPCLHMVPSHDQGIVNSFAFGLSTGQDILGNLGSSTSENKVGPCCTDGWTLLLPPSTKTLSFRIHGVNARVLVSPLCAGNCVGNSFQALIAWPSAFLTSSRENPITYLANVP